jgi:hypothetical protein
MFSTLTLEYAVLNCSMDVVLPIYTALSPTQKKFFLPRANCRNCPLDMPLDRRKGEESEGSSTSFPILPPCPVLVGVQFNTCGKF